MVSRLDDLLELLIGLDPEDLADLIATLPEPVVLALSDDLGAVSTGNLPATLIAQALEVDERYRVRPHLAYLSERVTQAVRDVEAGRNRMLAVSMPPRSGKSLALSFYLPLWLLRAHPDWPIASVSHDPALSGIWAKQLRSLIEARPDLGISLAPEFRGGMDWRTVQGGGMYATSVRGAFTGRGARCILIDDPVKDFVEAHSPTIRQAIWDWYLSVALTRLEPPSLVVIVMTRWEEGDLIGRVLSPDWEGDPADWEQINIPAVARADDAMGRAEGEPLLSPLLDETPQEATSRWAQVLRAVGTYVFSAMYQGRPAPAKGAIFDVGWWRYWTSDPGKATDDGRVVYLNPATLTGGRWLDSWDTSFDSAGATSSYVVGQRWVKSGPSRYLIAQQRDRWEFTATLDRMRAWCNGGGPHGRLVHLRLIEKKANGAAIISVLKREVAGLKATVPTAGKEARARAVTPECESGNVYLPHPGDPGNEWVADLLSELRNFPFDANDDQVDALTQALLELREAGRGLVSVPGRMPQPDPRAPARRRAL